MDNFTQPPSSFMDSFADSNCHNNGQTGMSDYSLGFMELLTMQDFGPSLSDVFPSPTQDSPNIQLPQTFKQAVESLGVFDTPATPNSSSISSESNDAVIKEVVDVDGGEEDEDKERRKTKKQLKTKKGIEKKRHGEARTARFAFMTKSEVDHLEDGYRWRKYGQKAVKNSPYPRSYYRCTSASCNVKKRVERSLHDPSVVVTTYEGQHTHESPVLLRSAVPPCSAFSSGGAAAAYPPSPQMLFSAHQIPFCSNPFAFLTDQDTGPCSTFKREGW